MENQQWTEKNQEAVALDLERTDESLNNGICDNLLENADKNVVKNNDGERSVQVVEAAISEKSRQTIQNILDQVKTLSKIEKLLLYLKLPTDSTSSVDPLRQPLNPLGSRAEIHRTISWIKTHLEEDPEISLPKQDVYEEYSNYCHLNKMKPLSQADFGKVMKQVYPNVRARRLGTRGNSRYCYSGLQRRHKLDPPLLSDLSDKPLSTEPHCTQSDLMAATWLIIKEWSQKELGVQFPSLHSLACYLVLNLSVSSGSAAATLITSIGETQLKDALPVDSVNLSKRKEMQLQLQKKLQQRNESNKEHKRKSQSPKSDTKQQQRCKRSRLQPSRATSSTSSSTSPISVATESSATAASESTKSPTQGPKSVCDKSLDYTNHLQTLPDFSSFQKPVACDGKPQVADYILNNDNEMYIGNTDLHNKVIAVAGKMAIPRLNASKPLSQLSPKRAKNAKYKAIQPKPEPCDIAYNPQACLRPAEHRSQGVVAVRCRKPRKRRLSGDEAAHAANTDDDDVTPLTRERLVSVSSVDKDAMDEYLGTGNSQEQEEELLKYFKNNNSVESNKETENSSKLSQLRQLLEQNGIADARLQKAPPKASAQPPMNPGILLHDAQQQQLLQNSAARRRVSFETPVHEETVPPSPNTRRKHFSFTPISPGPHSPNGRQSSSKCSSTTVSPFVSPRSTPVPRCKDGVYPSILRGHRASLPGCSVKKPYAFKKSTNLTVDVSEVDTNKFVTMSAPPSPMLTGKLNSGLLEKLLNSGDKVEYIPDYNQHQQPPHSSDALSTEVSHFFSSELPVVGLDTTYRSQSVPLHYQKMEPDQNNAIFQQFNFEFNDIESLSENINVNKIINALEDAPIFEPMDSVALGYAAGKEAARSVPNTPLPPTDRSLAGISRSYPSTPLLNAEAFSYDQGHNFLLNGQPVKGKMEGGLNNEVIYENMELYQINEQNLGNEVLMDDGKEQFGYDRQISDDNFNLKRNVVAGGIDESCIVLAGEQGFGEILGE